MAYYNREGKKFIERREKLQYLTSGECADIYHNNDIIFKEYFPEIVCRLSPEMFDVLKSISNTHFIQLYEIYCNMNLLELFLYKKHIMRFIVNAYTAKYYSDDSVNPLFEPIDYVLDNFYELGLLFDIFTDNSIVVNDVKRENAILSQSGIIIIDPDKFKKTSLPKEEISLINKEELLGLFRKICISSLTDINDSGELKSKINFDLANIDIDENTDIAYEISKKLRNYKRPIDYLIK